MSTGQKKKQIDPLDGGRFLYGGLAFLLAFLPLLIFWPATILTGPIAVFVAIYGWRKPRSITGGGRASFLLAIVLGLIEIAGWTFMIASFFT